MQFRQTAGDDRRHARHRHPADILAIVTLTPLDEAPHDGVLCVSSPSPSSRTLLARAANKIRGARSDDSLGIFDTPTL